MICYYIFNKLVLILIYNKNKKFKEFKEFKHKIKPKLILHYLLKEYII